MPVDKFEVGKWYVRTGISAGAFQEGKMYQCHGINAAGSLATFKTTQGLILQSAFGNKPAKSGKEHFEELYKGQVVESLNPPPDPPPPPPTVEQPEDPDLAQALRRFETGQMEAAVRRFLMGALADD